MSAREARNALAQEHARLCYELHEKREDLASTLREIYGRMVTAKEVTAHREAEEAIEDVRRRLSSVTRRMAAMH